MEYGRTRTSFGASISVQSQARWKMDILVHSPVNTAISSPAEVNCLQQHPRCSGRASHRETGVRFSCRPSEPAFGSRLPPLYSAQSPIGTNSEARPGETVPGSPSLSSAVPLYGTCTSGIIWTWRGTAGEYLEK